MAAIDSTTHKIGHNWLSARPQYSKTKANRAIHASSLKLRDNKNIPPTTTMNDMYSVHRPQGMWEYVK